MLLEAARIKREREQQQQRTAEAETQRVRMQKATEEAERQRRAAESQKHSEIEREMARAARIEADRHRDEMLRKESMARLEAARRLRVCVSLNPIPCPA